MRPRGTPAPTKQVTRTCTHRACTCSQGRSSLPGLSRALLPTDAVPVLRWFVKLGSHRRVLPTLIKTPSSHPNLPKRTGLSQGAALAPEPRPRSAAAPPGPGEQTRGPPKTGGAITLPTGPGTVTRGPPRPGGSYMRPPAARGRTHAAPPGPGALTRGSPRPGGFYTRPPPGPGAFTCGSDRRAAGADRRPRHGAGFGRAAFRLRGGPSRVPSRHPNVARNVSERTGVRAAAGTTTPGPCPNALASR